MLKRAFLFVAAGLLLAVCIIASIDPAAAAGRDALAAGLFPVVADPHAWLAGVGVAVGSIADARRIERKDAGDPSDGGVAEVKKVVTDFMTAWSEFKAANDQRLKEIERKGVADPTTLSKLDAIEKAMAKGEEVSAKFTAIEAEQKALKDQLDEAEKKLGRPRLPEGEEAKAERKARINLWARGVVSAQMLGASNLSEEQSKALADAAAEYKTMSVSNDTTGGYLAPSELVLEIIKGVTEISAPRQLVRVRSTSAKSYHQPKRTGQFAARRTGELETRTETDGLRYGMIEITAPEMYALIDISQQNLEDSAFDLETEIREESQEQFAVREGQEFVTGTGVEQMEGILVNGDVGTTNSGAAVAVTADGLITVKHAIKTAYARNASWTLNRTTLGSIRKLKDGNGQYLWMPGIAMGKPNTIDGDPYVEVPDMPNEGAGTKSVAYGDFRRAYTMVDRIVMQMLRDPYTQATSGVIRFLFRRRTGGRVVLAEAIRTLTCSP